VAIDYMYGAGRFVLGNILRQRGVDGVEIRSDVNPLFPGINPEPIEPHVRLLQDTVVKERTAVGFVEEKAAASSRLSASGG
jgi:phosphomannomutase